METRELLRALLEETEAYVAHVAHSDYEAHERFLLRREQLIADLGAMTCGEDERALIRSVLQHDEIIVEALRNTCVAIRQSWCAVREAKKRQRAYQEEHLPIAMDVRK